MNEHFMFRTKHISPYTFPLLFHPQREQLEEHQRRLIELGRELSDLHKRLPIMCGSKTLKPTRASSISGRTSDAARAAAAAALARVANKESKGAKKDEPSVASAANSTEPDTVASSEQNRDNENNTEPSTTADTNSTSAPTTTSSTVSLISVFSTSSLGRRRKTSSGSLCGTADTTLGPVLTAKQRAEHEERIQFTEAEVYHATSLQQLCQREVISFTRLKAISEIVFRTFVIVRSSLLLSDGPFPQKSVVEIESCISDLVSVTLSLECAA